MRTGPALRRRLLIVLGAASVLAGSQVGAPAGAQTAAATAEIALVHQPLFYRAGDSLDLRVNVTNRSDEPMEGFQIQAVLYDPANGRIDLHESFDGPDEGDFSLEVDTEPFETNLSLGESQVVDFDPSLSTLTAGAIEGVYPLQVELYDPSLTQPLDSFTTQVIYYPEEVEHPLNLALVVPVSPTPARDPSGGFAPEDGGGYPLEGGLAESGWIRGLLDATQKAVRKGLSAGLAPSPRFVEELAGMADGYARLVEDEPEEVESDSAEAQNAQEALTRLEDLLASRRIQALPSPYANPDLPTLYEVLGVEHVIDQLDVGRTVLENTLPDAGFDSPWLFVEGSRWDERTLAFVRSTRGDLKTFVDAGVFDPPINEARGECPDASPLGSFTCSVNVEAGGTEVPAYVRDPDVQNRLAELASREGDLLLLHRVFAETALIHAEQPDAAGRIIHATLPADWEPPPRISERLLMGLARAPWLAPRTPSGGLDRSVTPRARAVVPEVDARGMDADYVDALVRAARALATFTELGPPEPRLQRLRNNLLVAENHRWWSNPTLTDRGLTYATATEEEIEGEFDKISISGPDTTLTSQRSAVEVNIFNETTYPVTVDVDFESSRPDLRIDESDTAELQNILVEPGSAPAIKVDAIADTSGFFQVKASVESPETGKEINHQDITIRSTNFNRIALGLTLGALAVIILFYTYRLIRRRRTPPEDTPGEAT